MFKHTNFYIIWKKGEKGITLFDTDSHQFVNYNYDSNTINKFLNTYSLQKTSFYGYLIYTNSPLP